MISGINMVNKNRGLFLSPLFLFKSFELTTEVIEHNHIIFYAERVQEIKHSLGHHWRAAEVVLDVLWSVVLLEVGVAHHWSNEARSVHLHKSASAFESGRSLLGIMEVRIHRSNQLEPIERLY